MIIYRSALVPVISFGENDLYDQISNKWIQRIQEIIRNVTTISLVLIVGRGFFQYTFGILPRRTPVNTVGRFQHPLTIFLLLSQFI